MTFDRDTRRLLAELAFAAANQHLHKEARVFLQVLDLLIDDPADREACRAYLHLHLGELHEASACLGECGPDVAQFFSQMIAIKQSVIPSVRPLR
jgi:type III secretion system SsaH family protein